MCRGGGGGKEKYTGTDAFVRGGSAEQLEHVARVAQLVHGAVGHIHHRRRSQRKHRFANVLQPGAPRREGDREGEKRRGEMIEIEREERRKRRRRRRGGEKTKKKRREEKRRKGWQRIEERRKE